MLMLYPQLDSPCVLAAGAILTGGKQALPVPRRIRSSNPVTNNYRKVPRPIWPIVENPHALTGDTLETC
jgi:hypothetical protein